MKTPMQELLDFESELTRMFDSDERVAMAILDRIRTSRKQMLEKEKEVMCDFAKLYLYDDDLIDDIVRTCEELFNETFNTK